MNKEIIRLNKQLSMYKSFIIILIIVACILFMFVSIQVKVQEDSNNLTNETLYYWNQTLYLLEECDEDRQYLIYIYEKETGKLIKYE